MSDGQPLRRTIYLRWLVALLSPAMILAPAAAQERAPVPGEIDTRVTQATISSTICQPGYTAKLRPPRKFTDAIKHRLVNGLPGSSQDYELDHLIPLGLGGHPTSANNLWLQAWQEAASKDRDGRTPAASRSLHEADDLGAGAARHAGDVGTAVKTAASPAPAQ